VKVIVCGGRDYWNRDHVFAALDRLLRLRGIDLLIQGGATGADALAKQWCELRGVKCKTCPADWGRLGKRAGYVRNRYMLTFMPDGVVAFPGGRGTADMCRAAEESGVKVWRP
jgi:hypothetical protein